MTYTLHIGDTPYSSWSLRAFLALDAFGLPFETRLHRLYDPEIEAYARDHAPARTVPMLEWVERGRTVRVWDSLAIVETLAERHPDAGLWPADPTDRAAARSLAAEMHAGFAALRQACPMNVRRAGRPVPLSDAVAADVARVCALWRWALERSGGPWLSGPRFTAADAFYAPVAFRCVGYSLPIDELCAEYVGRLTAHASVKTWVGMALDDQRQIPWYENI